MTTEARYTVQDTVRFSIATVMAEGLAEVDPLLMMYDADERHMGLGERIESLATYLRRLSAVTAAATRSIVGH